MKLLDRINGQSFLLEEIPELRHVAGPDPEDVECFEAVKVGRSTPRARRPVRRAALQAHVQPLEAHAANRRAG